MNTHSVSKYRKGSFESKMDALLPSNSDSFTLTFFELWRDTEGGWSVNDGWTPLRDISRSHAIEALRGRWEVFKLNYLPKARVRDISDIGYDENEFKFEVDCTAFADVIAN